MTLNPCPFCGGSVGLVRLSKNAGPWKGFYAMTCGKSDLLCPLDFGILILGQDRDWVCERWNDYTMTNTSETERLLQEILAILKGIHAKLYDTEPKPEETTVAVTEKPE